MTVLVLEKWLDKPGLAEHFSCGIRWVEDRTAEGMPSAIIAGKRKYQASKCEEWLRRAGHLKEDVA